MSEFHIIESEFIDKDCLIDSLTSLGYQPEVHEEAVPLHGYQGDVRKQKAHIIIPKKQVGSASNDVGFFKEGQKYKVIASEYDRLWRAGSKINKLKQVYGEKVIMKGVRQNSKFSFVSRKENEKGEIKIRVRRF